MYLDKKIELKMWNNFRCNYGRTDREYPSSRAEAGFEGVQLNRGILKKCKYRLVYFAF
jgi:hypothetical protein